MPALIKKVPGFNKHIRVFIVHTLATTFQDSTRENMEQSLDLVSDSGFLCRGGGGGGGRVWAGHTTAFPRFDFYPIVRLDKHKPPPLTRVPRACRLCLPSTAAFRTRGVCVCVFFSRLLPPPGGTACLLLLPLPLRLQSGAELEEFVKANADVVSASPDGSKVSWRFLLVFARVVFELPAGEYNLWGGFWYRDTPAVTRGDKPISSGTFECLASTALLYCITCDSVAGLVQIQQHLFQHICRPIQTPCDL